MDRPPIIILGFVAAVLAVTGLLAERPTDQGAKCTVALDFIQEWHRTYDGKIAIGEDPMNEAPTIAEINDILAENPTLKTDPQLPAIRLAAEIRDQRPLRECPNIRKWLQANNIIHEDRKIPSLSKEEVISPIKVITLTMPVVQGERAFLFAGVACGRTCGGRSYVELARNSHGKWVVVDEAGMGVS